MKAAHQHINFTTGRTEWYTPQPILEAARRTMGGIDLDPASSAEANKRVKAMRFFTEKDNGLLQTWWGHVWLNWPFGRVQNPMWVKKMQIEMADHTRQICCLCFAATSEKWFQPLLKQPQCFLYPRTNFYLPDGTLKRGASKGSVVTYFGPNVEAFAREFSGLGVIKVPYV